MSLAHAKDLNNREDNNRREDHHREDHNSREDTSEDHKTGRNTEKEMTGSSIVSIIKHFVNNKIKKNKRKIKQTCENYDLQSMTAVEDDNARNAALEQQLLGMLNSSGSCSDVTFGCSAAAVNHVPASPDQLCREINTNARTVSSAS